MIGSHEGKATFMTNASTSIFRGVFTALITPFSENGATVDFDRLAENIHLQALAGVSGVVPCGTTGESPTLTEHEHRSVVEKTATHARDNGLRIIAGGGSNNTEHAIHLHRLARAVGADASLQVNPYYNKPSQEGLYRHFMAIADSCDLPIVLYNIPGRTGVCLTINTIKRLAEHPHIQAIKDATGGLELANATLLQTDLVVLSGDDPLTLPLASIGGSGVISVLSNLLPGRVAAMWLAIEKGDWELAREIHFELLPVANALLTLDSNPVPVKTALALAGRDSGTVRLPLVKPSREVTETIRRIMETLQSREATDVKKAEEAMSHQ